MDPAIVILIAIGAAILGLLAGCMLSASGKADAQGTAYWRGYGAATRAAIMLLRARRKKKAPRNRDGGTKECGLT